MTLFQVTYGDPRTRLPYLKDKEFPWAEILVYVIRKIHQQPSFYISLHFEQKPNNRLEVW